MKEGKNSIGQQYWKDKDFFALIVFIHYPLVLDSYGNPFSRQPCWEAQVEIGGEWIYEHFWTEKKARDFILSFFQ